MVLKKIFFSITILTTLSIVSCGKRNLPNVSSVFAFTQMSELATVEYTLTKVVKANDNSTWYTLGDRKIVMSVIAYAKAGIDLSKVSNKINVNNANELTIKLPPAKLISLNIPPDGIKEEGTQIGMLRKKYTNAEKNNLLQQAEQSILHTIDSLGILKKAELNAIQFVKNYTAQLGYNKVNVIIDPSIK